MSSHLEELRETLIPALQGDTSTSAGIAALSLAAASAAMLLLASLLSSVPGATPTLRMLQFVACAFAALIFVSEYLLRILMSEDISEEQESSLPPVIGYLISLPGILDLLAVVVVLFAWVSGSTDWLATATGIGLLKLLRYVPQITMLSRAIRRQRLALLITFLATGSLLLFGAIIMNLVERPLHADRFQSIAESLVWCIERMATLGISGVAPLSTAGRITGILVGLLGIALIAIPAIIVALGFADELKNRKSVALWETVARVPLFRKLDASTIASITSLLQSQVVPSGAVIVRQGDQANAMFFISEGRVRVDAASGPVMLGPGEFFGEIALLNDILRTATVTATCETRLLALPVDDFRRLCERYPAIRTDLEEVALARGGIFASFV